MASTNSRNNDIDHLQLCCDLSRADESQVPALVDALLRWAGAQRASDLHLDPQADGIRLRMRIDGLSRDCGLLDGHLAANIVARWKVLGGLLSYRGDLPQEGALARSASPIDRELRISCFPTVHGERVAVRIFADDDQLRSFDELGMADDCIAALRRACQARNGLVLVAGPCGSGKTTTLYACLEHIIASQDGRVALSIEDPVEQRIPGISQSQVQPAVGFDFPRALRSLLRQDPDVIMVGEIRDPETATVAVEAAGTGHLVLSCIHAPSAAAIPQRLIDLGVAPYALAACWRLGLAQRLLRRRCRDCGGDDCPLCGGIGYHGRLLIAEQLPSDDKLRKALRQHDNRDQLIAAVHQAGPDLQTAATCVVEQGLSDSAEVNRALHDQATTQEPA